MFFELRDYTAKPGQRDRLVKLMEEVIIPFQASQGIVVVGSFTARDEEDRYIWIRRFASEEERERVYAAVYQSEHWQNDIAPLVEEVLYRDRMKVTIIEATASSVLR